MKNLVLNEIFKILSREVVLEKPKDKSLAHYASPEAFALAKELRKAPKLIAEELAAKFKDLRLGQTGVKFIRAHAAISHPHKFYCNLAPSAPARPI